MSPACPPQPGADAAAAPPSRDPFNPFSPSFREDPYPAYRAIRASAPVHRSFLGGWALTRHADVLATLRAPDRFSSRLESNSRNGYARLLSADGSPGPCARLTGGMMIFRDPPDHSRLRRIAQHAFTAKAIAGMRPWVEANVARRLDALDRRGPVDVLAELAAPLPVDVISEMLGIAEGDRPALRRLSSEISLAFNPMITAAVAERGDRASAEVAALLRAHVASSRRRPTTPVLERFCDAAEHDGLDDDEIVQNLYLLFFAGHETTVNLIGNGLLALLRRPDQLALLRARPGLMSRAFDELLRFDGPFQLVLRKALVDSVVGGVPVRKGDELFVFLGAANHDPEAFDRPDELDLLRPPGPSLAFGHGVHYCLGAALARLEVEAVLPALLGRFSSIELAGGPVRWRPNLLLRGLEALVVELKN